MEVHGENRKQMEGELPIYVRAYEVYRERRWRKGFRLYRAYDVRFRDGEIQYDVDLDTVLQGARYPADFHCARDGAIAVAGEVGVPGLWVDYPYGRPLADQS